MKPVVVCWSGGKDSALALAEVLGKYRGEALLTTVTEESQRISMHGVRRELLVLQAEDLGLRLEEARMPAGASNPVYEEATAEALRRCEVRRLVFGDLFLEDVRAYRERMLADLGREIVGRLNHRKARAHRRAEPRPPRYDPEELLALVPPDPRVPFEIREVIARLVDASEFLEFSFAHLDGWPVGILGNNGVLFPESANKAAQFIQLCNQSRTPLVYLQNITGFMVGTKYEREGIVKHGSKMVNAVATSTVPQFTVIVGGSYGAGNYGMCGRAYDPRFLWTWPNSRIAVMGGEQAAGVLGIVEEAKARNRGEEPDAARIEAMKEATRRKFEEESSPYYATARLWDDGILDPRDTRRALAVGLSVAHNDDFVSPGAPRYGVFRM